MKKTILISVLAIMHLLPATAQLLGYGSMANPYRGTLAGDFTISGTKYFSGNIVVDNERLTLAAGTRLISTSINAIILVNGTGQLVAQGTSSNRILITADIDLDGINGEPTDTWGNITILSSGTSTISYCTIENGRRLSAKIGYYGGGLNLGTSTVTVSNSTIRNCIAGYGGGISIAGSSTPTITRCIVTGNTANEQGGAIYVAGGSSPVLSNNLIYNNNYSLSAVRRGGSIASNASSPQIVNTVIAYSNSPAAEANQSTLRTHPGARVINSVNWGGSDHIVTFRNTLISVINYCAIEGASLALVALTLTAAIHPDGPKLHQSKQVVTFTIAFVSTPCRDSGTPGQLPGCHRTNNRLCRCTTDRPDRHSAYEVRVQQVAGGVNRLDPVTWPGTRELFREQPISSIPVRTLELSHVVNHGPSFTLAQGCVNDC